MTGRVHKMRSQKGQTIIEVTIALAILVILGGAVVTIGVSSVNTASQSRMQAKATRIAEEALEIARHTRDQELNGSVEGLLAMTGTNACVTSPPDLKLEACAADSPSQTVDDVFTRTIVVKQDADSGGALITVTITWGDAGSNKTVELETLLTEWNTE